MVEPPQPNGGGTGAMAGAEPAEAWEFAGWGKSTRVTDIVLPEKEETHSHRVLGPWTSTAICGNDITSSCLYVSALCAAQAGPYAPLVLAMVAAVLWLFRAVYAEVGSALPLNGGTYTVLLNTTNKRVAAGAAVLTLLSYVATAVISANEAMHYAHYLWGGIDVFWATLILLAVFAALNVVGISESAVVALGIFGLHMVTLVMLSVAGIIHVVSAPALLWQNWSLPPPSGIFHALFFGFAAAMLGISGFESSANFIEEQKTGVFPKTLRNMWLAVAIFNPLISLLSLGLVPLDEISKIPPDLLAQMGTTSAGSWLGTLVSVDAVAVLSGAVLTSYVGVVGLMRRMALDRCLPQVLLKTNRARGTNHFIILAFGLICASIMVVTKGDVTTLAGVYTISFLSVMALFALGNMLLKVRRSRLPRETQASWPGVLLALGAVAVGLVGNLMMSPENVRVFGIYFAVASAVVAAMFLRTEVLRAGLWVLRAMVDRVARINNMLSNALRSEMERITHQPMMYFTRGDDPAQLNRAALYVLENEHTRRLIVVHVYEEESAIPAQLADHLRTIDHLYPQLRIDFLAVKGRFTPALIDELSRRKRVPRNYMFIGTPGDRFPHRVENLGGVRLIL